LTGRISEVLRISVVGLTFGISLCIVIQSQFFLWKFGPLDGRKIDWERWNLIGSLELVLWAASPILGIIFAVKNTRQFRIAISGLFFFVFISIGAKLTQINFSDDKSDEVISLQEAFSFDTDNNTLLIVIDTVQADVFGEILKRYSRELDYLNGFTYYPNTLGGYPTTRVSVPLILSGKSYKNEMPLALWLEQEVMGKTVVDYFRRAGRQTSVALNSVPSGGIQHPIIKMSTIGYSGWEKLRVQVTSVLDAALFSLAPTLAKPSAYDNGNWFLSKSIQENRRTPSGEHGADVRFVDVFEAYFNVQPSLNGPFKYFHLRGAHFPLQLDEMFEITERTGIQREDYLRQTRGVFSNLKPVMQTLINKGIYNNMEILIVSDHGTLSVPVSDTQGPQFYLDSVLSSSRPVFLHKRSNGAATPIQVSESARHLADIPCILSGNSGSFDCEKGNWTDENNRLRTFYFYRWKHKYWEKDYMPPIQSYSVSGDVRDLRSWSKGAKFSKP